MTVISEWIFFRHQKFLPKVLAAVQSANLRGRAAVNVKRRNEIEIQFLVPRDILSVRENLPRETIIRLR